MFLISGKVRRAAGRCEGSREGEDHDSLSLEQVGRAQVLPIEGISIVRLDSCSGLPGNLWDCCTLRDGGYYNNWDFSIDLIKDYIQALELAKIDFIELGFRFLKKIQVGSSPQINTMFRQPKK